jgi:sialidase-1
MTNNYWIVRMIIFVIFIFTIPKNMTAGNTGESVNVFVSEEDGYNTYRIPAIIMTPGKVLLAFCEGRVKNSSDFGNMDILLKRSFDGGKTWGALQVVADHGKKNLNGPVPVIDLDTGRMFLMYTEDKRGVFVTHSDDEGETWDKGRDITTHVRKDDWTWYATGPVHGIQLKSGRLLFPCDHMEPDSQSGPFSWIFKTQVELATRSRGVMKSHMVYSDDHGQTWRLGGSVDRHTDEATVVELCDGSVLVNMRNTIRNPYGKSFNHRRVQSISKDGGETWSSVLFVPEQRTPVCQGSVIRYSSAANHDKNRILYSGPDNNKRKDMSVWVSYDEGKTWPTKKLISPMPAAYSDMVVLPDMLLGLLYETGVNNAYDSIVFTSLSLDYITDGLDSIKKGESTDNDRQ